MIRKDFIEAEIQKLNQVLAKILSLKNDGNIQEGQRLAFQSLHDVFGLGVDYLQDCTAEDFLAEVRACNFSAAKLDMLARYLFEAVYPFEETDITFACLNKAAGILALLESKYRQQSLDNIGRREQIEKFLNNRQYE